MRLERDIIQPIERLTVTASDLDDLRHGLGGHGFECGLRLLIKCGHDRKSARVGVWVRLKVGFHRRQCACNDCEAVREACVGEVEQSLDKHSYSYEITVKLGDIVITAMNVICEL
jgi:hypothetical protein